MTDVDRRILAAIADNPGSPTDQIKRLVGVSGTQWKRHTDRLRPQLVVLDAPNHTRLWYIAGTEPEES